MRIDSHLTPESLQPKIENLLDLSAAKIRALEKAWTPEQGTPVFTVEGRYTARGWTEWTLGFMFGSALLQFDSTGEPWFLEYGRRGTRERMANYVTHTGVHDHGFNNVSTYGNLLRLLKEEKFAGTEFEKEFYELALRASGAVQAARWMPTHDGRGYIYSFHGPH
ncbi:MAG: glycosyl hydrolase, partial [Acidobacteriia bacterium]|nr:glycosyl hydrolase [Terriglobia bacterium]